MKYFNVYDSYMIHFFLVDTEKSTENFINDHREQAARFHRRDVFSARSRNDVGATKEAAQREGGKKGKGGSCRMERRQSSLAIFTLCGNHVFNLTYRNCASGLLLGIKKFPNEKLALDDFGKALKSILADAMGRLRYPSRTRTLSLPNEGREAS